MWCSKCRKNVVDCTCFHSIEEMKEMYENGLGLLAKKIVANKRKNGRTNKP